MGYMKRMYESKGSRAISGVVMTLDADDVVKMLDKMLSEKY